MATTINKTENTISVTSAEHDITVTNNNTGTSVSIDGNQVTSVTVGVAGVQGATGPQGAPGSVEDTIAADNIIQPFTHVTASGNISASGTIVASNLSGTNTGDQTNITGNAGTADQVDTILSEADAKNYITFVDSNNSTATPETVHTNKFLYVNPRRNELIVQGRLFVSGSSITLESGSISASNNIFAAGNITASGNISSSGTIVASSFTGDGSGLTGVTSYTNADTLTFINSVNTISSSAQIATDISGSFTSLSSSLEVRLASVEAGSTSKTLLSGSAQIATEISGAFVATSASLASAIATNSSRHTGNTDNISTNTTKITSLTAATSSYALTSKISGSLGPNGTLIRSLTAAGISGSFTNASASFSTRVTANDAKVGYTDSLVKTKLDIEGVISSSAQIASDISGSFVEASASFSTRVTANDAKVGYTDAAVKTKLNTEGVLSGSSQVSLSGFDTDNLSEGSSNLYYTDARVKTKLNTENVISASAQIATEVSGAFGIPSSSFSTRVTTLEGNVGQAVNTDSNVTFANISATRLTVTSITSSIVTSSILQTEGSNIFGDAGTDTHTFNGDIISLGNISASGYITTGGYISASQLVTATISHVANGDDKITFEDNFINFLGGTGGGQKTFFRIDDNADIVYINHASADIDFQVNTDNSRAIKVDAGNDIVHVGNTYDDHNPLPRFHSTAEQNRFTSTVNIINYGWDSSLNETFPQFAKQSGSLLRVFGHTPTTSHNPVSASIHVSSSLGTTFINDGHITASGNISASGNIVANNAIFAGTVTANGTTLTGDQDLSTYALISKISGSADVRFAPLETATGSLSTRINVFETATVISSSAQIASDISGSLSATAIAGLGINILSSSLQTFTNITASGDISASGTIIASSFIGPMSGTATSASRSDAANKVYTSQDNSNAEHFVTFVDSNNAVHADEDVHTTNFLRVNPQERVLIVQGGIKIPGSSITLESGSISASRDIFAPDITASGTISSSGDIHSATIRYVANIHDANNAAMISGTSTNLSLGDVGNGSNRTKITINDSARQFTFTSDESTEQSYNMPGVVTTNMIRTKNLRGQSPLIIDPTSVIISASQEFALGVGGTTSSLFLTSSITSSTGAPRIGFNTREPQTDFDVSAREVQFQRPGERKGLKINDEGNIESFDKSSASATTGSEFILNYSRGVTIDAQSMVAAGFGPFGAGEGGDSQAVDLFNNFSADKQNAVLEKLESLGFITPPQVGDTLGQIRWIAQSGSSEDFDARSTGEAAAIIAKVSEGDAAGISADLIFSVASKEGASGQKMLLDSNGAHEMTGSLSLGGNLISTGDVTVGDDLFVGDDIELQSDGAKIKFGADGDTSLTHVHNVGLLINSDRSLQFRDGAIRLESDDDGYLDIHADVAIRINDGDLIPATDDARTLGTSSHRWNDVFSVSTTTGGVFEVGLRTKDIGKLETGTIVSWKDGKCIPCCKSEDNMVMGVIKQGKDEPIVLGAEPVLVTGKVEEGDYIVTSDVVGHGRAAKEGYIFKKNLFGKVIAQALESAEGDSSLIKCMIRKM